MVESGGFFYFWLLISDFWLQVKVNVRIRNAALERENVYFLQKLRLDFHFFNKNDCRTKEKL
jgi:hypothetical protein